MLNSYKNQVYVNDCGEVKGCSSENSTRRSSQVSQVVGELRDSTEKVYAAVHELQEALRPILSDTVPKALKEEDSDPQLVDLAQNLNTTKNIADQAGALVQSILQRLEL